MDYKSIITDANVLYEAYLKAIKNSKWKESTQRSEVNFLSIIFELRRLLLTEEYHPGKEHRFVTYERGRKRDIASISVEDRTVMHAISDEIYTPRIKQKIIYDNSASVPERGLNFARNRFEVHLHKFYRSHSNNQGYILLGDFSKFYKNIDQTLAKDMLLNLVDHDEYMEYLEDEIFDSFSDGVSIGNQHSQSIGTYYPHRLDNYVKIVRGFKYYGRYMDDFYVISDSKEELYELLDDIRIVCSDNHLILNESKTRIVPLNRYFTYLQIRYCLTDTGRVIKRINPKRITTMRRKLKSLKSKIDSGEVDFEYVEQLFRSWMGSFYKLMSKKQRSNLINLYETTYNTIYEIG